MDRHTLAHHKSKAEASPPTKMHVLDHMPSIDRVVGLMPGFVYVFNHVTYSNDYSNRSIAEHLGYDSAEIRAFGDRMMMEVVHPDDHPALAQHMGRIAVLEGEASATLEYRVRTKTGQQRWLRSVDTVFDRLPDGRVLRHIGCASDITVEKEGELHLAEINNQLEEKVAARTEDLARLNNELEARILARTSELQEAVDELEQLTYIATHDLKVPANNLSRLGLMLRETADTLTPDQVEMVNWVNDCVEQLDAKLQGLVLVAKIRLGQGLPTTEINLREVVTKAVGAVAPTLGGRVLPIQIDVPEGITARFSEHEIESILAALLDNAVKYAEPSRPLQIKFHAGVCDGQVWLKIKDNGTGLDAERDKDKVFGLFQRAHKSPAGSGISLYCAQRMLQRRGGVLEMAGRRSRGAEFSLIFPIEEATL